MIINIIAAIFLIVIAIAFASVPFLALHQGAWTRTAWKRDLDEIKQIPVNLLTIIRQIHSDITISPIN